MSHSGLVIHVTHVGYVLCMYSSIAVLPRVRIHDDNGDLLICQLTITMYIVLLLFLILVTKTKENWN